MGNLNPIHVLEKVIGEYKSYLQSEFRAKDPALRQALSNELDRPLFLAQEPFYQAHRPFKLGAKWRDLPLDPRLAKVMEDRARKHGSPSPEHAYQHQALAIQQLRGTLAKPVVVTTGTGSGKTEAFLLPVIQNAIDDAVRYKKSGLTAILVYPMNALANDQKLRIETYLEEAGFAGTVDVRQYDRGTPQSEREEMRRNPPHILLTNYMMLEYLLVRPADRDGIFANHRCRFLVLDEVHTYRGTLGANIALLIRRLKTHLLEARQDWKAAVNEDEFRHRFPVLLPVGTSATIKTVKEQGRSREEVLRERDAAVQDFFGKLTGCHPGEIQVYGEELEQLHVPEDASYSELPAEIAADNGDLAKNRLLWDLNEWLIRSPLSAGQIVERLQSVPARQGAEREALLHEVESALIASSDLPDGSPGSLRLRAHRFIRGGWRFHRCVDPRCGRLYPMGEERCACGAVTAPLYLCRNCGADYLRFVGDPAEGPLRPASMVTDDQEWLLYEFGRFEDSVGIDEEEDFALTAPPRRPTPKSKKVTQVKGEAIRTGSFDPVSLAFSDDASDYALPVQLLPKRSRCLCCGGSAGSRDVITPVALGTSAAVKVLAEGLVEALAQEHQDTPGNKERLLIFSDSRQDAAHQARFIVFSSRYDRMRRRVYEILQSKGPQTLQRTVELLGGMGADAQDNPHAPERGMRIYGDTLEKMRAWEEAPLLDDLAVNAGYRATIMNLGLVTVEYDGLAELVESDGGDLCNQLGVNPQQLTHICRCLLDEMRKRGAVSREMLRYHPMFTSAPDFLRAAEWERRIKSPNGFVTSVAGEAVAFRDRLDFPDGITPSNLWRRPGAGGRGPALERVFKRLLQAFGGIDPAADDLVNVAEFLRKPCGLLEPADVAGYRERAKLLQVSHQAIMLKLTEDSERLRCGVCGTVCSGSEAGDPCPRCHGCLVPWTADQMREHRTVQRILSGEVIPLVAGEHTAQVPHDQRGDLEVCFKAEQNESRVNVLACSPTLEMGIDVGGLDAVVLRNIPPRPDNYAQRGGRAGRRSRVGVVVGYCRSTPHDQYFFDKPAEMISGEVPAPSLALGNQDVVLRHLNAIVFGAAQPGLAGKMADYVSPTGELNQERIDELIQAVEAKFEHAVDLARQAFGTDVFMQSEFNEEALRRHLGGLPAKIRDIFDRTSRQVIELRQALNRYSAELQGQRAGTRAGELVARLLGIPTERQRNQGEADDRSAGYPLRRFAEFGVLPGYEFPTEPASLRLMYDLHEEDPVTVNRRFGITQFQPEASVYARTKRWKVTGLDMASPWNPRTDSASWLYRACRSCHLRYSADAPVCPRCGDSTLAQGLPAMQFGGFVAKRDENPILDEEERYAASDRVRVYPQWDGDVVGRWDVGPGWALRLSSGETVNWLNEGPPPKPGEIDNTPCLHTQAKGFLLCATCGGLLTIPANVNNDGGRRRPRRNANTEDPYGHRPGCGRAGSLPIPQALLASSNGQVMRLMVPVPGDLDESEVKTWGYSLGYALLTGMQRLYMLDPNELHFELEGPWKLDSQQQASLAFVDTSLGGTGYLNRIASEFNSVADTAIGHLDHANCETACYRCLKSYQNQRHHENLNWPLVMPHLQVLADAPPERRPRESGDIQNPGPWLEAYAAGVGSPLELAFLRLFEKHGFVPEKQVSIAPIPGRGPITTADFAVSERRLAIYVDGAAFHTGSNLRRDRYIRIKLREAEPPWRVEELRAKDLAKGKALVERILSE